MAPRIAEWASTLSGLEVSEVYDLGSSLRGKIEDVLQLSLADASLSLLQERLAELRWNNCMSAVLQRCAECLWKSIVPNRMKGLIG